MLAEADELCFALASFEEAPFHDAEGEQPANFATPPPLLNRLEEEEEEEEEEEDEEEEEGASSAMMMPKLRTPSAPSPFCRVFCNRSASPGKSADLPATTIDEHISSRTEASTAAAEARMVSTIP